MKRSSGKKFKYWLSAIGGVGVCSRIILNGFNFQYVPNTFVYLDVIIIGTLFAMYENPIRNVFANHSSVYSTLIFVTLALYIGSYTDIMSSALGKIISLDITAIFSILLLLAARELAKREKTRFLNFLGLLGRRSYGMYLFHWMILNIMFGKHIFFSDASGLSIVGTLFALFATISVSLFSYKYFEQPFLTLRRRFQANA